MRACVRERVRAYVCVRERERERESVCVSVRVCVGGGGRLRGACSSVCLCESVWLPERASVNSSVSDA